MSKKTIEKLTRAEKMRLLREINEFDDQIEPVSLGELQQIEVDFKDEKISPEVMAHYKQHIKAMLEEAKSEHGWLTKL